MHLIYSMSIANKCSLQWLICFLKCFMVNRFSFKIQWNGSLVVSSTDAISCVWILCVCVSIVPTLSKIGLNEKSLRAANEEKRGEVSREELWCGNFVNWRFSKCEMKLKEINQCVFVVMCSVPLLRIQYFVYSLFWPVIRWVCVRLYFRYCTFYV